MRPKDRKRRRSDDINLTILSLTNGTCGVGIEVFDILGGCE